MGVLFELELVLDVNMPLCASRSLDLEWASVFDAVRDLVSDVSKHTFFGG